MASGGKNFTVYKSSAGSGKTFTLVKEYLKIILSNPDSFRHVLAVTFTNKAANEMKERIIRYLKSISDPVAHPDRSVEKFLLPDLVASTGLSEHEVRDRANLAVKLIMHHYSDFAVSTIDSFFHRVVRTFAYDLNIPLSFDVVMDEEEVLSDVVGLLLDNVGSDEKLTRVLVSFVNAKAEDEKNWDIEKDLTDFSRVLIKESSIPYLDKVSGLGVEQMEEARNKLWGWVRSLEEKLGALAGEWLLLLERNSLEEKDLAGGSKGMVPWLKKCIDRNYSNLKVPSWLDKGIEKEEWSASKADTDTKNTIRAMAREISDYAGKTKLLIEDNGRRYMTAKVILKYLYPMAVLGALERELKAYKKDNGVLLISEFNRRINEVVSDQPAPFIFERIGEKYRHFMVDEFQDTSLLQWQNILPLMENSLAEGHGNLVVGDGKQAIYRFREGDVRQFEMLPAIMCPPEDIVSKSREQALVRNYNPKTLDKNYRSAEEVVRFNNTLFRKISGWWQDQLLPVYQCVEQEIAGSLAGSVRIEFAKPDDEDADLREWMHAKVLGAVDDLLSRGFHQSDIAILCRENRNASEIATRLLSKGMQVISADSLVLSYSPEVNLVMAWMKYLSDPEDDISRAHILFYLAGRGQLPVDSVEQILLDPLIPDRWKAATERSKYLHDKFLDLIGRNYPGLNVPGLMRMDLYHLAGELMRHFIDLTLPDPYLQFFQDQMMELLKKDKHSLYDAVEWWEEKGRSMSISTPDGLDAIRVMTIHKSKGLEFPVVIYPFATSRVKLTNNNAWVQVKDPGLKEELPIAYVPITKSLEDSEFTGVYQEEYDQSVVDLVNIFYVAMTRARDHLFVFTSEPPEKLNPADSIPKMLKRFLVEAGLWRDGVYSYPFGAVTGESESFAREPLRTGSPMPVRAGFFDWKERVRLKMSAPEHWAVTDPDRGYAFGNKVHYILSKVKYATDLDEAMNRCLLDGVISSEEYQKIEPLLKGLVLDSDHSWLFNKEYRVQNEADLITASGEILRPDRLMFKDNIAIVVDYKTGRQFYRHLEQVKQYAGIVAEMGWDIAGAYVLYLNEEITLVETGIGA